MIILSSLTSGDIKLNVRNVYLRIGQEIPSRGIIEGTRPEPTLEQAREELARAIHQNSSKWILDDYGPLARVVSETTIIETLKSLEASLTQKKANLSLVLGEIFGRVFQSISKDSGTR